MLTERLQEYFVTSYVYRAVEIGMNVKQCLATELAWKVVTCDTNYMFDWEEKKYRRNKT